MTYTSCHYIENALIMHPRVIQHCCIPVKGKFGSTKICDYHGGPLPIDKIKESRMHYRKMLADIRSYPEAHCNGCVWQLTKDWESRYVFNNLHFNHSLICNLNCNFCVQRKGDPAYKIPDYDILPVVKQVLESDYLDPDSYIFWAGGEPTLLADFGEALCLMMKYGTRNEIATNSTIFCREIYENLSPGGRLCMKTSVDCGTPETFLKMKGKDWFYRVWDNLRKYASTGGEVSAKYIISHDNCGENDIRGFVEMAKTAGIRWAHIDINHNFKSTEVLEKHIQAAAALHQALTEAGIQVGCGVHSAASIPDFAKRVEATKRNKTESPDQLMENLLQGLCELGMRTAVIYGAGKHLSKVLPALSRSPLEILTIVDDNTELHGKHMLGWTIAPPGALPQLAPDVVIISSDSVEERLYRRARRLVQGTHTVVSRLYRGTRVRSEDEAKSSAAAVLSQISESGAKSIAVYPGGKHTRKIASSLEESPLTVKAILDDKACGTTTNILGWPILKTSSILASPPDAILVSSDTFEDIFTQKIGKTLKSLRIPVYTIYQGGGSVVTDWSTGKDSELSYWKQVLSTLAGDPRHRTRDYEGNLPEHIGKLLDSPPGSSVRILDVGSGPLTKVGTKWTGRNLEVVCVDPLADKYNEMLDRLGFNTRARPIKAEGEHLLDMFPINSFDLVHSLNALDHSYDPVAAINNMISVCKATGLVYFAVALNEGQYWKYEGMHQWNFDVQDDEIVIWNRHGQFQRLTDCLPPTVELSFQILQAKVYDDMRPFLHVTIRKGSQSSQPRQIRTFRSPEVPQAKEDSLTSATTLS